MLTWADVVEIGMRLPGTEESTSYRQPALKVKGKLYARHREEGGAITVQATFAEREALIDAAPEVFYLTDHYKNYEWVIVRLTTVPLPMLAELMEESWRRAIPPRFREALEAELRLAR
jgi:hypothetical protein